MTYEDGSQNPHISAIMLQYMLESTSSLESR